MRIAIVASSYPRFDQDGNARFMRSIAEAQAARGHEVHVIAPYAPQVRPYATPVHLHWFRYGPAALSLMGHAGALENDRALKKTAYALAPLFFLAQAATLARVIRRHHIDLIHAHWVVPNGVAAALLSRVTGLPLFVTLHGSDVYLALRHRWLGRLARGVFARARAVTACSPDLAEGALKVGADPGRVTVIPYGASPDAIVPKTDDPELRARLGLPPEAEVVLALGRLVGKKGFAYFVQAVPQILAERPNAWFVIVGEGAERAHLQQLAQDLNVAARVLLPGAAPWADVSRYLSMSALLAVPSVHDIGGNMDGLPNTVLEAMAAARPVVATPIGGIPLAIQSGQTGLLVPEADATALAAAIVQLLQSPEQRNQMGRAARDRIERELNWNNMTERFEQFYAQALPDRL